jgi:hypothetical protein
MAVTTDDIARAVAKVARASVSAKSKSRDPLDQRQQLTDVRAAWELLQKHEPILHQFLQMVAALDPYKLISRAGETRAAFLARMQDDAECDVDIWDSGIRAGLTLAVPDCIASALAKRLRSPKQGREGRTSEKSSAPAVKIGA